MQKVKYTYQDWVEGNIKFSKYGGISLFNRSYLLHELSSEDTDRIAIEQNQAFLHYLSTAFEALKRTFISEYNYSVLKDEFLNYNLSGFKRILDTIRTEHEIIVTQAFHSGFDGRFELTKSEVDTFLSTKVDSEEMEIFAWGFLGDVEDVGFEFDKEEQAPLMYILRSNFYSWLVWFKKQQELKNIEPSLKVDSAKLPKGIEDIISKGQVSYTWLGKSDELPELYQRLIDKQLIDPDTTEEQFKAVFEAKPLQKIKEQPIKWHDENASELLYFILQLKASGNIKNGKQTSYQRLTACFVKPDGSRFDSVFKSLKQRIEIELSEPKQKTIREIISNF